MTMDHLRARTTLSALLLTAALAASAAAGGRFSGLRGPAPVAVPPAPDSEATAPARFAAVEVDAESVPFLRVAGEEGRAVVLEIAARTFVPARGEGPAVTLVGVAHIGDPAYYRAVQTLLDAHEVVLYESVRPAGTGTTPAASEAERIARTRASLRFVGGLIERYRERHGAVPADLASLRRFAAEDGRRFAALLDAALTDGWGRTPAYALADDPEERPYRLRSFGADGRPGGTGTDADIALDTPAVVDPPGSSSHGQLQSQLAQALALAFQLEVMDYEGDGWRCSDLSIDEIQDRMAARGSSFELVEDALAGGTLPTQVVRFMLGFIRMADAFASGAISDTLKILLIEMLSDESLIAASLEQFDEGFGEVIIGERNQVVVDDLRRLIVGEPEVETVAIFYGAGHMRDLVQRLADQLGYVPRDEQWLNAIEVDLTRSAVTEADVARIRQMMRMAMRQMERAPRP